jgi:hypothetical protein
MTIEPKLPDQKQWYYELFRFFDTTPDGARFLLVFFKKPLTDYTPEEWATMQKTLENRALGDFPKYLRKDSPIAVPESRVFTGEYPSQEERFRQSPRKVEYNIGTDGE